MLLKGFQKAVALGSAIDSLQILLSFTVMGSSTKHNWASTNGESMKDQTFRIRQARRSAMLSQTALAEKVGVNRSAVAQWERPGGSRPTAGNLSKIAIATNIQFEWLATGRGRMTASRDGEDGEDTPAPLLKFYARDEIEERALFALRKLEHRVSIAIVEMAERISRGAMMD